MAQFRDEDISPTFGELMKRNREKGIEQGIEQIVYRLFGKGYSDEEIADIVDLTVDQVQELKKKL